MNNALLAQRCWNHAVREAAARCPECGGFFCRECITEHDGRVICSGCLEKRKTPVQAAPGRRWGRVLIAPAQLFLGVLCAWIFFYLVGRLLVSIPSSFHEGTMWRQEFLGMGSHGGGGEEEP